MRSCFYGFEKGNAGWGPQARMPVWVWDAPEERGELIDGRWPRKSNGAHIEAVVPVYGGVDRRPRVAVGSWRLWESDTGLHAVHVVGAVNAGSTSSFLRKMPSWQVHPESLQRLSGGPRPVSDVRLRLKADVDRQSFLSEWRSHLPKWPGIVALWDQDSILQAEKSGWQVRTTSAIVRTSLLLAMACVATIAWAVQGSAAYERRAQYHLLRQLGARRSTLLAAVLGEVAILAILALGGAYLLALAMLTGLAMWIPFLPGIVARPDAASVLITAGVVLLGVVVGAAWPACRGVTGALREADVNDPRTAARFAWRCFAGAVGIAGSVAFAIILTPPGTGTRASALTWLGVPALTLTSLLLIPVTIRSVMRLGLKPAAWLTGTDPLVLADQVSGDGARSAGAVAALTVGLGAFFWVLCWGASMLDAFIIDSAFPRWLVVVHPYGLDRDETQRLLANPHLGSLQPLTLLDTRIGQMDEQPITSGNVEHLATLVMGVNPEQALGNGPNALPFRFRFGDPSTAAEMLADGDACLVSDWFALSHNLAVGDKLPLVVPGAATGISPEQRGERTYRIAGIVDLPGWRMVTKHSKTRQRHFKLQVLVVLNAETMRNDFPVAYANYFLGDVPNTGEYPLDKPLRDAFALSRQHRTQVEGLVREVLDLDRAMTYPTDAIRESRLASRSVLADDLDRTRRVLATSWGGSAVRTLGSLPLFVLGLSLIAVSTSLVTSLNARTRQLGVLRCVGMSRWMLLRMVLAESLLVGTSAIAASFFWGSVGAWLMLRVASIVGYHLMFPGIRTTFQIPWPWLAPGFIVTVLVCTLAAIWAGWNIGRRSPIGLLTGNHD